MTGLKLSSLTGSIYFHHFLFLLVGNVGLAEIFYNVGNRLDELDVI